MKILSNGNYKYQTNQAKPKRIAFKEAPIFVNGDIPYYLSKNKITELPAFIRNFLQNEKVKNVLINVQHNTLGLFVNLPENTDKALLTLKKLQADRKDIGAVFHVLVNKQELLDDEIVKGLAIKLKQDVKEANKIK